MTKEQKLHRKMRREAWLNYFRQFRKGWKYAAGAARHYARMSVDRDLAGVVKR